MNKRMNPYLGNRGNYYVTHAKTKERVICVWDDLVSRDGKSYHDAEYTPSATVAKWIDARDHLLKADKVMLTRSRVDQFGDPTRERETYIALFSIKNCRVGEDGLRFDFDKRLESY